jgi:hypothetical protein
VERPLRDMRRPLFFRVLALALAAGSCATRAKRDAGTLRRAGCERSEHHPLDGAVCASEARPAVSPIGCNTKKR